MNATFKGYTLGIAGDDLFVCVFPFGAQFQRIVWKRKKKIKTCERVDCRVEERSCTLFGIISLDTASFKRGHRLRYLTKSKSRMECPNNDLSKCAYHSHQEEVVTGNATPFK